MKKSSLLASTLALTLAIGCLTPASNADAASKLSLSTKKVTLKVSKSTTVHANKKVTWKSSNTKIAKVKKLSSKKAKITAKATGSCKITATNGKSKAVIRVTVKKSKNTVTATPKPTATVAPVTKPQVSASSQPVNTLTPEEKAQLENAIPEPMPGVTITPTQSSTEYTASADGILFSITDCSATGIKYTLSNTNDTDAWYGQDYTLQKLENDNWKNIPYLDNTIDYEVEDVAYQLSANTSLNESIDWNNLYGSLDYGTYRVSKTFHLDSKSTTFSITCEFVISESTSSTTTSAPAATPAVATTEPGTPTATPVTATMEPIATSTVAATPAPGTVPMETTTTQPANTLTPEEKEQLENAIPEQMPTVTATPAPIQDSTEYTASADGILISVTEYTPTGIKYTITNSNTTEISFGYDYILQKSENGNWVNVPYQNNDWAFPAIAIGLPANNSYKASINWEYMYGALTNGTYRIVKSFYHNSNKYDIAFEFVIDETTPVNTAVPTTTPEPGTPTATPAVTTTEPAATPAVVFGN